MPGTGCGIQSESTDHVNEKPAGSVARLRATDPAVVEDVAVFCREARHELLESDRDAEVFYFRVRKGSK